MEKSRFKELMKKEGYTDNIIEGVWEDQKDLLSALEDGAGERAIRRIAENQKSMLELLGKTLSKLEKIKAKMN